MPHPFRHAARPGHCLVPVLLFWPGTIALAQQAQFTEGASFGSALAMDGNVLAVGAPWENDQEGAVYVYRYSETAGWSQEARLASSDGQSGDTFGAAVAVSGSSLVVGAPGGGREGGHEAGAAYVFQHTSEWEQIERLTDPLPSLGSRFGQAVAVHGIFAMIGAPLDNDAGTDAGTAHVYSQSGARAWTYSQEIRADRAADGDRFGSSISLDAEHAVVGAPGSDEARGRDAGLAYVFQRSAGAAWHLQAVLTAGDAGSGRHFGTSVTVSRHLLHTRIMVGAPGAGRGAVYYFALTDEIWRETHFLRRAGSGLGAAVALHNLAALAGAPAAAQVLVLAEEDRTGLELIGLLPPPAMLPGSCFGCAVGASDRHFAVGAPAANQAPGSAGTVYLFDRTALPMSASQAQEAHGASLANYPNPFRTLTTVTLDSEMAGSLRLEVLDAAGRSAAVLFDGVWQPGRRSFTWHPRELASGIYFATVYRNGHKLSHPMLLVR